jgi:hypothetical protein
MADFADEAEAINQLHLENSLAAAKQKAVFLKPKGFCHYCEEAIPKDAVNQKFCDEYCCADYQKYVIGRR